MALTAEGIVPWPVTRITSASGSFSLARANSCSPSISFITRSVITRSKLSRSINLAPCGPLVATVHS